MVILISLLFSLIPIVDEIIKYNPGGRKGIKIDGGGDPLGLPLLQIQKTKWQVSLIKTKSKPSFTGAGSWKSSIIEPSFCLLSIQTKIWESPPNPSLYYSPFFPSLTVQTPTLQYSTIQTPCRWGRTREWRWGGTGTRWRWMQMKGGGGGRTTWWRSERVREKKACLRSDVGDFRPNNFNNNKKSSPLLTFLPLLISRYSLSLSLSWFNNRWISQLFRNQHVWMEVMVLLI